MTTTVEPTGLRATPEQQRELDLAVVESRKLTRLINLGSPTASQGEPDLDALEDTARRARHTLSRFDHESDLAREAGDSLPESFYTGMGRARVSVRMAERAVAKEKERAR